LPWSKPLDESKQWPLIFCERAAWIKRNVMKKPAGSKRTLSQRRHRRRLVYYRIPFLENIFLPRLERASKRRCFPEWCCLCSVAVIELDALALMWIMALISSPYTLSAAVGERCGRRHFCGTQFYGENYYCGAVPSRWEDLWVGEEVVCYSFDSEKLWANAVNYLPLRELLRLCALISPFACLGNVSGGGKLFGEDTSLSLMMARLHHLIVLNWVLQDVVLLRPCCTKKIHQKETTNMKHDKS
jgi:hypothetical protein